MTGLPIFQLHVPPYVIWRSVSSKIGNMGMSGYRMLTVFYSFDSKCGFVIHSRFLWNMVNKWSEFIMSVSIGMKCILCSILNGDLQSINNESLEKYFILPSVTHFIIYVPATIPRTKQSCFPNISNNYQVRSLIFIN